MSNDKIESPIHHMETDAENVDMAFANESHHLNQSSVEFKPNFKPEISTLIDGYLGHTLGDNRDEYITRLRTNAAKFVKQFGDMGHFPLSSYDFAMIQTDKNELVTAPLATAPLSYPAVITPIHFKITKIVRDMLMTDNKINVSDVSGAYKRIPFTAYRGKLFGNDNQNDAQYTTSPRILATFPDIDDQFMLDEPFNAMDLNDKPLLEEVD